VAFLGTNALSFDRGLTTPDAEEADVKHLMLAAARQRFSWWIEQVRAREPGAARHPGGRRRADHRCRGNRGSAQAITGSGHHGRGGRPMIVTVTPNPSLDHTMHLSRLRRAASTAPPRA
jgi:hypothetical protein